MLRDFVDAQVTEMTKKEEKKSILVIGHKNPDTDAICAAICYAGLKNKITNEKHIPARAGKVSSETQYVLDYFGVEQPELIEDVRPRLEDISIRYTTGVRNNITMKKAWEMMSTESIATIPVVDDNKFLTGVIANSDIAMGYMEVNDPYALSKARPQYRGILETLNGTLLNGNEHAYYTKGRVVVAAGSKSNMAEVIREDDMVILSDRDETQRIAIAQRCACLIVTDGIQVSEEVLAEAKEKECVVISTPFDTYAAARLIYQSIPIKAVMHFDQLVTFDLDDFLEDVMDVMSRVRHRDFPVLDENRHYVGMFSRRNLMSQGKKRVILVDHNEKLQAVEGIGTAEVLEIIDHHRLGSLETMSPVFFRNVPLGSTCSIIYQMYKEYGVEIDRVTAGLLCAAIVSDTLMFKSPTCTAVDEKIARELAMTAGIDLESFAVDMFRAGANFDAKTDQQICYQDFKTFDFDKIRFGVGQVLCMTRVEVENLKNRLEAFLPNALPEKGVNMAFFMITCIWDQETTVISAGQGASEVLKKAFPGTEEGTVLLKNVVSRKKQFIPDIMSALV